jgi:hypothetical protein
MNRRTFCISAAATVAASRANSVAAIAALAQAVPTAPSVSTTPTVATAPAVPHIGPLITLSEIEAIDRERILRAANEYLTAPPITITASSSPRSKGGKHD